MAEFVGGEPVSVGVDGAITFENKTDTAFNVGCGIVFRKSGLYRVSIVGKHMSVAVEPERKTGEWIYHSDWETDGECGYECSECGMGSDVDYNYCMKCGADMRGKQDERTD